MPSDQRQKILIVEDDLNLAELLNAFFHMQGYNVRTVAWGTEAVEEAATFQPDLIVLDIRLPDIDGFNVREQLEKSHKTRNIPVIFLTEISERGDKLHGLEMDVADYITKPFDIQELRLRVRNALQRAASVADENPITNLPEGPVVDETLQTYIAVRAREHSLLITGLRGLNSFRELYGFVAADDVMRVVSMTVYNSSREIVGLDVFCGHLDAHTFVTLTPENRINRLQTRIQKRIGDSLEYFYPGDNRGSNAHTDDRLRLLFGHLHPMDGPFSDLDDLKTQAFSRIREDVRA